MIHYRSMNVSGEYIRCAVESVPEEVLGMESVGRAFDYLGSVIDSYEDNWIDPDSDYYAESLWEAQREGAVSVAERYRIMLEEALYRQDLFGEQFDLRAFVERLSTITLDEVLEEAR
jgi:hypothetical protein